MPPPRPLVNWNIEQLESEFARAREASDQQALQALVHELGFRSTGRARRLRSEVEGFIAGNKQPKAKQAEAPHQAPQENIPSKDELKKVAEHQAAKYTTVEKHVASIEAPIEAPESMAPQIERELPPPQPPRIDKARRAPRDKRPQPTRTTPKNMSRKEAEKLLSCWTALEVLSPPQTYRQASDLANGERRLIVELNTSGQLPWLAGERSRPNTRLYYQVVVGVIDIEIATESLLTVYSDQELERVSAKGFTPIAILTIDQRGIPVAPTAITISSFAWGFPLALKRSLSELSGWPDVEPRLVEEADRFIRQFDANGNPIPLGREQIELLYSHLTQKLGLASEYLRSPSVALRVYQYYKAEDAPDPPPMGSYFLGDLAKVHTAVTRGEQHSLLEKFIGLASPDKSVDIQCDDAILADVIAPSKIPPGCWPAPGGHPLVLLQQAAVNLAASTAAPGHLLPVNGPPGTGKTTLLRDLIVSVVVKRAEAMCEFDSPADAFTRSGTVIKSGQGFIHHYKIDPKLVGFEMVVASSNNKAVENISAELPALNAIDTKHEELRYFKSIADNVARGPHDQASSDDRQAQLWGSASAAPECWGLIAAVLGNAKNRYQFRQSFWNDEEFGLRRYLLEASGTPQEIEVKDAKTGRIVNRRKPKVVTAERPPASDDAASRRWSSARRKFLAAIEKVRVRLDILEKGRLATGKTSLFSNLSSKVDAAVAISGPRFVDAAFFERPHSDVQRDTPWLDKETQALREEVFVSAMQVHRAFIDGAAKQFKNNIDLLFKAFFGHAGWSERMQPLMPELWSTFFCIVPTVSTTFASIERMFGYLPPESIGWLLIDEAGQSAPQAAIGALFRSKQAVIVGDPLQLPPVTSLPTELADKIAEQFGIDKTRFCAPDASVQSLADTSSEIGTTIRGETEVRVGVPLVVHRRCAEPMFSLSNKLAYAGTMVHGRGERISSVRGILGPSAWIDVKPTFCEDKWSVAEGKVVIDLFRKLERAGLKELDIYLISPFRIVAQKLRELLVAEKVLSRWTDNPREWVKERVGTVYTVQGREAETVIMVLGAAEAARGGARAWAGQDVNQLNVAITRAKENLYVVGHRYEWASAGKFEQLERLFPL